MVATPYVNHLNAQKHCTEPKLTKHCGLRAGRQKEQKKTTHCIVLYCLEACDRCCAVCVSLLICCRAYSTLTTEIIKNTQSTKRSE